MATGIPRARASMRMVPRVDRIERIDDGSERSVQPLGRGAVDPTAWLVRCRCGWSGPLRLLQRRYGGKRDEWGEQPDELECPVCHGHDRLHRDADAGPEGSTSQDDRGSK